MLNYEHETKDIKDRYLKNFICFDYFHDSVITKVTYEDKTKSVRIDMSCEREWPINRAREVIFDDNYMYSLFFTDCRYFEYERTSDKTYTEY
ncbi:MAG: hypothetical protein K0S61_4902 [Anaerocolumna sp.]|jgi:hypothetical protein|nr:hypothetical protein [Anaerocolumna sp.]